ncbi:hypothetical protein C8Q77DRAFT_445653 [Trametes polyzona]|nr:hypothetical protein C8Q77DRAFT_445653 [Trametes polyzona]
MGDFDGADGSPGSPLAARAALQPAGEHRLPPSFHRTSPARGKELVRTAGAPQCRSSRPRIPAFSSHISPHRPTAGDSRPLFLHTRPVPSPSDASHRTCPTRFALSIIARLRGCLILSTPEPDCNPRKLSAQTNHLLDNPGGSVQRVTV